MTDPEIVKGSGSLIYHPTGAINDGLGKTLQDRYSLIKQLGQGSCDFSPAKR